MWDSDCASGVRVWRHPATTSLIISLNCMQVVDMKSNGGTGRGRKGPHQIPRFGSRSRTFPLPSTPHIPGFDAPAGADVAASICVRDQQQQGLGLFSKQLATNIKQKAYI